MQLVINIRSKVLKKIPCEQCFQEPPLKSTVSNEYSVSILKENILGAVLPRNTPEVCSEWWIIGQYSWRRYPGSSTSKKHSCRLQLVSNIRSIFLRKISWERCFQETPLNSAMSDEHSVNILQEDILKSAVFLNFNNACVEEHQEQRQLEFKIYASISGFLLGAIPSAPTRNQGHFSRLSDIWCPRV